MFEGGIYTWALPAGRTLAGFIVSIFLGILGGWLAVIFNSMVGYPWSLEVHRTIYFVGIGLGAGLGAYVGWVNLDLRWQFVAGSVLLVLLGGIAGTYIGLIYGQHVEPSYLGRMYTIDSWLHLGGAVGAIAVATTLGLIHEVRTGGR